MSMRIYPNKDLYKVEPIMVKPMLRALLSVKKLVPDFVCVMMLD
jgi:hypothetical protein